MSPLKDILLKKDDIILNPPSNFSHKDTQRDTKKKIEYPNHPNEKLLEVQKGLAAPTY